MANSGRINNVLVIEEKVIAVTLKSKLNGYLNADTTAPRKIYLDTIRDYYAPLVDKYGKLYREALENLNHVQGLLSNWALQEEGNTQGLSQEVKEEMFHC
jgi:hypothetical protein